MKIDYIPLASGFNSKYVEQWADARERDASAVSKVANVTGGSSAYLEMPEQAAAVYTRILSEMNQRYVIGYYPTNILRDGTRRKIRITTLSGKEHKILGRTSYVAPEPGELSRPKGKCDLIFFSTADGRGTLHWPKVGRRRVEMRFQRLTSLYFFL